MNLQHYQAFTDRLIHNLEAEPGVLALVATGSMAGQSHPPDGWSDHDFWVVSEPGRQQQLRERHDWLPACTSIALAYQETAHGVKVLYRGGHLLEYAVFAPDELGLAQINDYRVLFDRADVAARLAELRVRTIRQLAGSYTDDRWLLGQLFTALQVGVGRYRRGERLSGHRLVAARAPEHLLRLLHRHVATGVPELRDDLDPWRRFERLHPELGQRLGAALLLPVPEAALHLLDVAEDALRERISEVGPAAWMAIRNALVEDGPAGWDVGLEETPTGNSPE